VHGRRREPALRLPRRLPFPAAGDSVVCGAGSEGVEFVSALLERVRGELSPSID
jgi:NADH dehydrogenase FAD-containing subunit